ncbi:uncharacterized protein K444DRAFT_665902 [Hyaloscypha bicolor E]|uniref:Uncharacterized protein n=1 Tax=Hyaloscypha bicolor E TaxID=1095630 RepID=A0A2J6SZP0_9HELO|nr:uncharacterized protein K444DRAFT_665902 [Hyaloscypha bicolor E]PMD56248.1 hypothetical protein K444DRAFT_665902 [Hyaloscypha bicolor E]
MISLLLSTGICTPQLQAQISLASFYNHKIFESNPRRINSYRKPHNNFNFQELLQSAMDHQNTPARHHQPDTPIDRSTGSSGDLTPMERWARENAKEEPWNAVASKTNPSGGEYSSGQGTSSTRGQSGSVGVGSN